MGTLLTSIPAGPSYALLLDVTPVRLRERAAGISNVVMAVSLLGSPIVGGLSTLFNDNLRIDFGFLISCISIHRFDIGNALAQKFLAAAGSCRN